jgi:Fic family protein
MKLSIIPTYALNNYLNEVDEVFLASCFNQLRDAEISTDTFSFYTSVSSVFSSKIEGEAIELDSYIKHKKWGIPFQVDYTKKIDDLYNAYSFAKINSLNQANVEEAHRILSKHLLSSTQQGKIRTQNMFVTTPDGRIEYVAASPDEVIVEMQKFYADLEVLKNVNLSLAEIFYYASMIHLVFVKIHPWNDGNGRSGRLIEKWFLAEKLGEKAWFIESEKYYYQQHQTYYQNIRMLGLEYLGLDYSKAMSFLMMLYYSMSSGINVE